VVVVAAWPVAATQLRSVEKVTAVGEKFPKAPAR
jgi:hypothetical protein